MVKDANPQDKNPFQATGKKSFNGRVLKKIIKITKNKLARTPFVRMRMRC